jgi:RNA polymerase sigma-70 factor (ECF subfamily)
MVSQLQKSPEVLMLLVQHRDALAFERLYYKMSPIIWSFAASRGCPPTQSDDIVQEVFCRVWERPERFQGRATAKTYLLGIAWNVISEQRRVDNRVVCTAAVPVSPTTSSESSTTTLDLVDLKSVMRVAKSLLPKTQSAAITLFYDQQMKPQQAADLLGCTVNAFHCRLERARRKLYKILRSKTDSV